MGWGTFVSLVAVDVTPHPSPSVQTLKSLYVLQHLSLIHHPATFQNINHITLQRPRLKDHLYTCVLQTMFCFLTMLHTSKFTGEHNTCVWGLSIARYCRLLARFSCEKGSWESGGVMEQLYGLSFPDPFFPYEIFRSPQLAKSPHAILFTVYLPGSFSHTNVTMRYSYNIARFCFSVL